MSPLNQETSDYVINHGTEYDLTKVTGMLLRRHEQHDDEQPPRPLQGLGRPRGALHHPPQLLHRRRRALLRRAAGMNSDGLGKLCTG